MEAALPSLWASLYSWLSPTVLFLLLNLVIGTIVVTSKSAARHRDPEDAADQPKLARAPSAIFGRLRSFKFAREPYVDTSQIAPTVVSHNESQSQTSADEVQQHEEIHFIRSQSDAQPTAGEVLPKLASKLKKSASTKSAFPHFAESDIVPPPPPAAAAAEEEEEVEEVDVQADAFINRFRKQLQLQRLDSLLRYKEMLNRGR